MKLKDFLGMMKLGLILAIFATAACIMLAFVYARTKPLIDQHQKEELVAAEKELFHDADGFEEIKNISSRDPEVTIMLAYAALKKNGEIIGAVLELSRTSYSGPIITMVGVNRNGFITGVKILEHSDTPGFGANAASPKYFVDSEKHKEIYEKVLMAAYPSSDFIDREKRITFYGQFAGKHVSHPFRVNHDVIAITASTITSTAVSASVKAAADAANEWFSSEDAAVITSKSRGGE